MKTSKMIGDSKKEYFDLDYVDLPISNWVKISEEVLYPVDEASPAEYEEEEITVNYVYRVDPDEMFEFFWEEADKFPELNSFKKDGVWDQKGLKEYIEGHLQELFDKYEDEAYDYFEPFARKKAEENYED